MKCFAATVALRLCLMEEMKEGLAWTHLFR